MSEIEVLSRTQRIIVDGKKSVSVVRAGPIGPPGPTGPPGVSAGSYDHVQASPSTVWTVQHNLGYKAAGIKAFGVGGAPINGSVSYVNNNVLLITFSEAVAGTAQIS